MRVLVLQHIPCEPPGVFEDVLRDRRRRTDPVFGGLDGRLIPLQWHGDTFDLPAGAFRLAGSLGYENQAFRASLAAIENRADEMRAHGRALLERWLDLVAA